MLDSCMNEWMDGRIDEQTATWMDAWILRKGRRYMGFVLHSREMHQEYLHANDVREVNFSQNWTA